MEDRNKERREGERGKVAASGRDKDLERGVQISPFYVGSKEMYPEIFITVMFGAGKLEYFLTERSLRLY